MTIPFARQHFSAIRDELEERDILDEARQAIESALIDEFGARPVEAPMQAARISACVRN